MSAPPPTPPRPWAAAAPGAAAAGARALPVWLRWAGAAVAVYAALLAAHWPLLHLPYYWDEAGYFIPAALDLFRHGWWIPRTTLANGHPPLLMAVLALAWHVLGVSIVATRATMLIFGAALILGVARLARRFSTRRAAWLAAWWLALMPLVFAQSTLAQLDLPAAALATWALAAWARGRRWRYAGLAAAACLTKETAILVPLVLGAWALADWIRRGNGDGRRMRWWPALGPHLIPAVPLAAWFAYYHAATGFWMGNAGFLAYNLQTAASLPRIGMALALRVWQLAGYDGMAAVTIAALLAALLAGRLRPRREPRRAWWRGGLGRREKLERGAAEAGDSAAQPRLRAELWSVIAAYVVFHALIGGAVLDRYLLPAIALYIALLAPGVAAMVRPGRRRVVIGAVAAFLAAGWFWNPPYPFPYEDNLAYATFVRLQQRATAALAARRPAQPILTAWPATNELTDPDLGYVTRPLAVAPVENFSAAAVAGHRLAPGQYALLYSRIYQPAHGWWGPWSGRGDERRIASLLAARAPHVHLCTLRRPRGGAPRSARSSPRSGRRWPGRGSAYGISRPSRSILASPGLGGELAGRRQMIGAGPSAARPRVPRAWPFWLRWKRRFFHYEPPLSERQLLARLGGRRVWGAAAHGQWAVLAVGARVERAGR